MSGYDSWKLASPEDSDGPWDRPDDDDTYVECSLCDKAILDGASDNIRIGRLYCCPECGNQQEAVIEGRGWQLAHDERRDDR